MKMSLVRMLALYAVGVAALPVLAIGALVLIMNSNIVSIAESELNKISINTARQVISDTLKICQIVSKAQSDEADNARNTAMIKFSELGSAKLGETFFEADLRNCDNPAEKRKMRVQNFSIGKAKLRVVLDSDSSPVSSDGDIKKILESLKAELGMDFSLLLRINGQGDMMRASSTMRDRYGNEIIGDYISSENPIIKSVLAKKSYSGMNHSDEIDYIVNYYPITDDIGDVVGAISYAKVQNSIDYVLRYLEGVRLGANGYVWAIELKSDSESVVRISRDASVRGMVVEKDMSGARKTQTLELISSAIAQGENVVSVKEYSSLGANSNGDIVAAYVFFKPWNMLFGATIYRADFEGGIEKISAAAENFIWLLIPLGVGMLLFAGVCAYIAAARGSEMVGELSNAAKLVEHGDIALARQNLERTIKSNRWSNLEIYELRVSLMRMSGNLSKLVSNVKFGGENLAESAAMLASGAAGIEEIATAKAKAWRNVSTAIGSITNTVRLLKTGARVTAKNLEDTLSVLSGGAKLLHSLDESAKDLMEATDSASSKLSIIKERTDRIADSITSINSISARINMLSVNASMEAEKARGFGEGFESVSQEIKKLADSISVSAMRISRTVSGMSGLVESGVGDMSKFAVKMRDSSNVISRVSESLTAVETQVANLGPEFEKLANSVEAQAENAVEISKTMRDMTISASQTRNEIVEFKSAADSVAITAEELKSKMARFNLQD